MNVILQTDNPSFGVLMIALLFFPASCANKWVSVIKCVLLTTNTDHVYWCLFHRCKCRRLLVTVPIETAESWTVFMPEAPAIRAPTMKIQVILRFSFCFLDQRQNKLCLFNAFTNTWSKHFICVETSAFVGLLYSFIQGYPLMCHLSVMKLVLLFACNSKQVNVYFPKGLMISSNAIQG